ncbi:twin-arginine translocase subunit TatC [Bacteroidia bacterium]|nr:twin-arginine translocase subunit TatC [Bacteroidia bacterium]MDC1395052.1 twin-arginine translocase subunit TatC [Bacteroidia bacterium]
MPLDQIDVEEYEAQMSFLEHLEALRWHLVRGIIAIFVGAIVAFAFGTFIFDKILLGPTQPSFWTFRKICELSHFLYGSDKICIEKMEFVVKTVKVQEQFFQHMMIALLGGIIIALPYILYEIYRFVKPALKAREKKFSGLAIFFGSALFFIGLIFGYFILAPISINFLGNYTLSNLIEKEYTVTSVVSIVSMLTLGAGLIFELPLVIYLLAKVGLVTGELLASYRRMAFVVVLVISAIITPPDIASQIILSIPIMFLYEIGIVIAKKVNPHVEYE